LPRERQRKTTCHRKWRKNAQPYCNTSAPPPRALRHQKAQSEHNSCADSPIQASAAAYSVVLITFGAPTGFRGGGMGLRAGSARGLTRSPSVHSVLSGRGSAAKISSPACWMRWRPARPW
jgi:hypothetical protein